MIKVCHVSTVHPAFDGRIFDKQCVSLVKAGYDVSLVIPHSHNETVQGVKILALKKYSNRINRIILAPFFAFFKVLSSKAKIIEFHDPELMFMGVWLKILGKKVIFDSHENVTSQIEGKSWIKSNLIRNTIKVTYRLIEKFCIVFFDKVISVTPEIVVFLSSKKGVLIRNYPILSHIVASDAAVNETTRFIYVGGLTKLRGIHEICEAMSLINGECELVLAGPWESEEFKNNCLNYNERISYSGVLPLNEVYKLIASADIGLATLHYQKNYLSSLPVKAFEYMANGLPLIMSDIPYWMEHYESYAKFVNPLKVSEIVAAMEWMISHHEERKILGKNGRKAVIEKYSWEAESEKLIAMYQELSN